MFNYVSNLLEYKKEKKMLGIPSSKIHNEESEKNDLSESKKRLRCNEPSQFVQRFDKENIDNSFHSEEKRKKLETLKSLETPKSLEIMDPSSFEQCLRQFNHAETRISMLNEEIKKIREEKKILEHTAIQYIQHHNLQNEKFVDRETQNVKLQLTSQSSFAPLTLQSIREKLHEYFGDARDDEAEELYNFLRDSREKKETIFLKRSQNK